jgi:hypothetical protein
MSGNGRAFREIHSRVRARNRCRRQAGPRLFMFDLANGGFAACRLRRESFTSAGLQSFKFEGCRVGVGCYA